MARHPLALAAALLAIAKAALADGPADPQASPRPADPGPAAAPQQAPPAGTLAAVDGVVRSVDLARHDVTLEVNGSPVVLGLDRNTLVYLPAGLSTPSAIRPGDLVRAGRNAASVAYWIQVRSSPDGSGPTPSTPGQGTGPGGGTAPPREGAAGSAMSAP